MSVLAGTRLAAGCGSRCLGSQFVRSSTVRLVRLRQPCRPLSGESPRARHFPIRSTLFVASLAAAALAAFSLRINADAKPDVSKNSKYIRLSELRKHGRDAERIWVHKGTGVYDITDWVPAHPGGSVILQAAAGSIDPFWKIFTIHQKEDVYDILEEFRIGDIDPRDLKDGKVPVEDIDDPFASDPKRDPLLIQHSDRPCNAETPGCDLSEHITPNSLFYVRNHLWVPNDLGNNHVITVELGDGEEKEYTVEELRKKFKEHTITATLQCSGNRRKHMTKQSRATNGLQWDVGAIGNAQWTGVRLADVLADAGLSIHDLPEDALHVQFMGAEAYGASIPIDKAVDSRGDVLLAYKMNGKPLPPDHGYPLRVLVPGYVAARSVKWVNRINVSDEESHSQWQRRDYKCFGPNEGNKPNWDKAPSIQEMPVQSAITSVRNISALSAEDRKLLRIYGLEEDSVALEGYAFSGGGRRIIRVDVSMDGGHTWDQAELNTEAVKGCKRWSWTRWNYIIPKRDVGSEIVVKAVDDSYNSQPDTFPPTYNFRGNLSSAWHRVPYEG